MATAYEQMRYKRHFLAEHPKDSDAWQLPEWLAVAADFDVAWCYVDQCMARRAHAYDQWTGREYRIKKPSEFWASDERLIKRLRPLVCDRSHDHVDLSATSVAVPHAKAKDTARWPISICHKVAAGCEEVLQDPRTAECFDISVEETYSVGVFVSSAPDRVANDTEALPSPQSQPIVLGTQHRASSECLSPQAEGGATRHHSPPDSDTHGISSPEIGTDIWRKSGISCGNDVPPPPSPLQQPERRKTKREQLISLPAKLGGSEYRRKYGHKHRVPLIGSGCQFPCCYPTSGPGPDLHAGNIQVVGSACESSLGVDGGTRSKAPVKDYQPEVANELMRRAGVGVQLSSGGHSSPKAPPMHPKSIRVCGESTSDHVAVPAISFPSGVPPPAAPADAPPAEAPPPICSACDRGLRNTHADHTRRPPCKYPHIEPEEWACPGCKYGKGRLHPWHNHVAGECRVSQMRAPPGMRGRSSGRPEGARPPAPVDPSAREVRAGAPPVDGDEERAADERPRKAAPAPWPEPPSPGAPGTLRRWTEPGPARWPERRASSEPASSSRDVPRAPPGALPPRVPRRNPAVEEEGAALDEDVEDGGRARADAAPRPPTRGRGIDAGTQEEIGTR